MTTTENPLSTGFVDCCDEDCCPPRAVSALPALTVDPGRGPRTHTRRDALRFAAGGLLAVGALPLLACADDEEPAGQASPGATQAAAPVQMEDVKIAFCSQVLCVLPFEVANRRGLFEKEGARVELVYMRGGAVAMQSLLSNSIDFIGTPMDVVVSAHQTGKDPLMVASTSSLPFFALLAAPSSGITKIADLKGKKIGVGNLNTTDHFLARYLLEKNGIDDQSVEFVAMGPNLFEGLVRGQVDAGLVQEPALTLAEGRGATVLVNFMSQADSRRELGGPYQFMGLNTRKDVIDRRPQTIQKLIRALAEANRWIRANPGAEIVKNIPADLVAARDFEVFAASLDKYKQDLYPENPRLDASSVQRVIEVQKASGALTRDLPPSAVFTNSLIG